MIPTLTHDCEACEMFNTSYKGDIHKDKNDQNP